MLGCFKKAPPEPEAEPLFGRGAFAPYAEMLNEQDDLTIFLGSTAMLFTFYVGAMGLFTDSKKRAWLITTLSSLVMTIAGLFFTMRNFDTRGNVMTAPDALDSLIANAICLFFLSYCIVDAFCCAFFYPDQESIGYAHHAGYAALLVYLMSTRRQILFAVFAIEELPTLFISIYELRGETRPRLPTGLAIFSLRMTYHLFMTYQALSNEIVSTGLFFFSTYLLLHHTAWFRSWFFKRVEAVKAQGITSSEAAHTDSYAKQKSLKLEVVSHVYLVSTLLSIQTAMHAFLVITELRASTNGENFVLALDLLGHGVCFVFVTARMVGILQDVYAEHFIMHTIEQRSIIYNISWEDPRVEREKLKIGSSDVILTISSAGCNVLDYLIEGPKAIVACDFNQAQLAMLELKLACIMYGSYEDFWKIWAESCYDTFIREYQKKGGLREKILASKTPTSESTVQFWDENGKLIKDNIMFAGSSGLAARLLYPLISFIGVVDYMIKRKAYAPANVSLSLFRGTLQSQWLWKWVAPLGGVPESQLNLINRVPHIWAERLEEVIGRRMWLKDNYFYYAYVAGKWIKECCPRYLEEDNFLALQKHARRGAVTLIHGGWADGAETRPDFTIASLLDSMDWMPDSFIAENIARLVPQMECGVKGKGKTGVKGYIFWRSFGTKVHSPVLASLQPELIPDTDGSERVGWYLTQWLATVTPGVDYSKMLLKGSGLSFRNTPIQDLQVIAAMTQQALAPTKDSVEFYKSQGTAYDGFREALLPDRDLLQQYCLPWHTMPKTWISVGCGTARDIEYVIGHIKACGTHVYLLDLSPALLEMAAKRVLEHGLSDQVTLVIADILEAYSPSGKPTDKVKYVTPKGVAFAKPLPDLGSVDLVTCSFCMTMIPPWKACLDVMVQMLKPGGSLSIVDFTKREDTPNHWTQHLNAWWFANDGVYLDNAHTAALQNHCNLKTVWYHETEARVPYTVLQATHYLYTGVKI